MTEVLEIATRKFTPVISYMHYTHSKMQTQYQWLGTSVMTQIEMYLFGMAALTTPCDTETLSHVCSLNSKPFSFTIYH